MLTLLNDKKEYAKNVMVIIISYNWKWLKYRYIEF